MELQNFSVPHGNDVEIILTIIGDPIYLPGATVTWTVYPQTFGVPDRTAPIFSKTNGSGASIPGSPAETLLLEIAAADTVDLLRNYFHEAVIVDINDNTSTVVEGIMTVT